MNKYRSIFYLFIASILTVGIFTTEIFAETAKNAAKNKLAKPSVFQARVSTVSSIYFYNTNYGILGHDVANNKSGGAWPRGTNNFYIYGGGAWFGTIKNGKKIVSIGYNPNSGVSQFAPGQIGDPAAKDDPVNDPHGGKGWKYYDDNGANYILYFATDYDLTGKPLPGKDVPDWPLRDSVSGANGKPTYVSDVTLRKNYPPFYRSGEDMFAVYKDTDIGRDPEYTGPTGKSVPIGIEVHQTTYSWGLSFAKDYMFCIYEVINKSGDTLRDCYLAPAYDFDIGPAADDDRVKFYDTDPTLNLGYVYDGNGVESGWSTPPGVVAFDFLESPINPATGRQLGLATWKNWVIANDPPDDPSRYDFMAAGVKDPDDAPGDKRVLCATGPFSLNPNDTARVVVAIICAKDIPTLLVTDALAQGIYDKNYLTPQPPTTPTLKAIPISHGAKLVWDTLAEASHDVLVPDSLGKPFVGYRLYRSLSSSGPWTKLKEWNISSGILAHSFTDIGDDDGDGTVTTAEEIKNNMPIYYWLAAFDAGTSKPPIIDSLETPPRKDVNMIQVIPVPPVSNVSNSSFGAPTVNGVMGGVSAPNFFISNQDNFNQIFNSSSFKVSFTTVNTGATFNIPVTVKDIASGFEETYTIATNLRLKPDSTTRANAGMKRGTFKQNNIFKFGVVDLRINWEFEQSPDTFAIKNVTVTKTNPLTDVQVIVNDSAKYATVQNYNRNLGEADYEVEFLAGGKDTVNAAQILDYLNLKITNKKTGLVVAEGPRYKLTGEAFDSVGMEQWQMYRHVKKQGSPLPATSLYGTGRYYMKSVVGTSTFLPANILYVAGARIVFDPYLLGASGGYPWTPGTTAATTDFQAGDKILVSFKGGAKGVFPVQAVTTTSISASQHVAATVEALEKIKIVPNPFLVGHIAQKTTDEPKIFFNHLPEKCKISIFNVAGDLVVEIDHNGGSSETWNLISSGRQRVASQLLIALIEADGHSVMKKFAVITGGFRVVN